MPPPKYRALMLRTCKVVNGALVSPSPDAGGFVWPRKGYVECPDWNPRAECGNGLHGLLWGEGEPGVWEMDGAWMVCAVDAREIMTVERKIKVPRAWVVFVGDRVTAYDYMRARDTVARSGYASTLTGGDGSTLTGGDASTLTGGNRSTLTGGYASTLTGGDGSTLTGGDGSTLIFRWWDGVDCRYRVAAFEVDGVTVLPGVKYRCERGALVVVPA